jgi:hypothetical protein
MAGSKVKFFQNNYTIKEIGMKKVLRAICGAILMVLPLSAENFIKNSNFDQPLKGECRIGDIVPDHAKLSYFTEDLTWNKCAKFELISIVKKSGHAGVNANLILGEKPVGFPVKPQTIYQFSLEIKGTAPSVGIRGMEWTGADFWKDRRNLKTKLGNIKIPAEWQKISGTFTTGPKAQTAVLAIQMWWDTQYGPMEYKVGDYILIDNVVVEEMIDPLTSWKNAASDKLKTKPLKIALAKTVDTEPTFDGRLEEAAWGEATKNSGFKPLSANDKATEDTIFMLLAGKDSLYVGIKNLEPQAKKIKAAVATNGGAIWRDDVTEIFFGPVANDRKLSQFAIAAGGGKFTGNGDNELPASNSKWEVKTAKDANSWSLEAKIPYTLLGWKTPPVSGDSVAFNIGRQRTPVSNLSTWSRVDRSFHDVKNFGRLIIGSTVAFAAKEARRLMELADELPAGKDRQGLIRDISRISQSDNPQDVINQIATYTARIRSLKLGNRKFVVTTISPTHSPVIPLIPNAITAPPEKIAVQAAINDLKSVPLAITNLTDKLEEYRVSIVPGHTYDVEMTGLTAADGSAFPVEKIILLRGVRVKDRDGQKPIQCFDPLVPLDESATVAAAPNDSALIWAQFDCKGVRPGNYAGVLRVVPQSESATVVLDSGPNALKGWTYKGDMLDLPFEIDVLPFEISSAPVKPWDMMRVAYDEQSFKTMIDQDIRVFMLSCWYIMPKFNQDGSVKEFSSAKFDVQIQNHLQWAKKYGVANEIKFGLGLNCYGLFMKYCGGKQFKIGSPEWQTGWKNYVKCMADAYQKNGIPLSNVYTEIVDEPELQLRSETITFAELVDVHRLAKEAAPEMKTFAWLDCHTPAQGFEKLIPYLDVWGFYGATPLRPDYQGLMQKLRANGTKIWMYCCNTAVSSDLYSYYRRHAWIAYQANVDVIGFFIYADATQGGWARFSWKAVPSGGVVYRSGKTIITSIRNECLKLGNQDIKYLECLKQLVNGAEKRTATVINAENFLKTAVERVIDTQAHDRQESDKVRQEAIAHIMAISGNN